MKQTLYNLMALVFTLLATGAKAQIITTIAGSGKYGGDGGQALSASVQCRGVAVDAAGNIFISDPVNNVIRKVNTSGIITTVAGSGVAGYSGDGGAATNAQLSYPSDLATDNAGNIYIADASNNRIRKVDASGIIYTVAGSGTAAYGGDGAPATNAGLSYPSDIAVDNAGNLYIADESNNRIRKVDVSGIITTVAGNGTYAYTGDGGAATVATLKGPSNIAVDGSGNLYIGDQGNAVIRKVNVSGIITTVAGSGTAGYSGDGGPATNAKLWDSWGLAVDGTGNIFIADGDNYVIRKVNTSGIITTVAGIDTSGYSGDGGAATAAKLSMPTDVVTDGSGNLFIADKDSYAIRKINTSGIIATVAGNGAANYFGDGGPATTAGLSTPWGIAVDGTGNIFVCDATNNVIRRISTAGIITTVAGTGIPGYSGDGGAATNARLGSPYGIAVDGSGNLFVVDANNVVRKINTSGIITTVAGNGIGGYSGNGGPATNARLGSPYGIAVDGSGNLFIAEYDNNVIRKVNTSGIITTIAGNGTVGSGGDGGPATNAQFFELSGIAIDGAGNIYAAQYGQIRKIDASGMITTVTGNSTFGCSGDGGSALSAEVGDPFGLAPYGSGGLLIADLDNDVVRGINTPGVINRVAGTCGVYGYSGDGGLAMSARLSQSAGIALDNAGNLFIADAGNNRIRKISALISDVKQIATVNSGISISPNPAKDDFTIRLDKTMNNGVVEIYNVMGEKVYQDEMRETAKQVRFSGTPGIYIAQVRDEDQIYRTKLVIQ